MSRDTSAKNVEILIPRHQLAVAQHRDPWLARELTWSDRAWLTLLAGQLPQHRLSQIRLIVTREPCSAGTATCCVANGAADHGANFE